jgi:hypothetical protein
MISNNEPAGCSKNPQTEQQMAPNTMTTANAVAIVQARFLHGMVPVMADLDDLGTRLTTLKAAFESMQGLDPDAEQLTEWIDDLARTARQATERLRTEAAFAGFGMDRAVAHYRESAVGLKAADHVEAITASGSTDDWDQWTTELHDSQMKGDDDE